VINPKKLKSLAGFEALEAMLDKRNEHPEKKKAIDLAIRKKFEATAAVWVLDMSGFSRTTKSHGIIHYLAMIRRMRLIAAVSVGRHHGHIIKFVADNCFAVFPTVRDAVAAAKFMHDGCKFANMNTPDAEDIHVCIGIGYGPALLLRDDYYGDELNLAAKLGEDVAKAGETLLTAKAYKAVARAQKHAKRIKVELSGVSIPAFLLREKAGKKSSTRQGGLPIDALEYLFER
jgi:adenylate cyclase